MPLQLRDDLHWCNCAGRAVFLDIKRDRYFCLPAQANEAFLRLVKEPSQFDEIEHLDRLVGHGFLIEDDCWEPILPAQLDELPIRDFLGEQQRRPNVVHILRALTSEIRAAWMLKTRSFQQVIEIAAAKHSEWNPMPRDLDKTVAAVAAASTAVSLFTRAHDRCLVRALAVYFSCCRSGIRPRLVFGVIAHPFSAHCWVQFESTVLVGGFEQARLYTPILVVE